MDTIEHPEVAAVFNAFPEHIRHKLLFLRRLVLATAAEADDVYGVVETLKWGEPSYLTDIGSAVRIGWKKSTPDQFAMYFHCRTKLVETFRELYSETFTFEGNRAILFHEADDIPIAELKHCIALSLTYHKRKHLPLLGG